MPLSADVAPQLTLFGSPGVTRSLAWSPPPAPAAGPDPDQETGLREPAFERRALLRSERRRLVSDLNRRDGSSHREINAWLNRKLRITSVKDATLEDLERSVELLVGKLIGKH